MKRLLLFCLILFTFGACAPRVSYVGKSYPRTMGVEVFYSKDDVGRSYETMGHAEAESVFDLLSTSESLQRSLDQLKKEAATKGADAIIVEGIGTSISTSGSNGDVSTSERKKIKATLIKYK